MTGLEFHKNEKGYEAFVKKKYAFGTKGIPREETNWLEVLCDFPCMLLGCSVEVCSLTSVARSQQEVRGPERGRDPSRRLRIDLQPRLWYQR